MTVGSDTDFPTFRTAPQRHSGDPGSLDLDRERGLLGVAERLSLNYVNLLHDIDGTPPLGGWGNAKLAQAREHIEAALDLVRQHLCGGGK